MLASRRVFLLLLSVITLMAPILTSCNITRLLQEDENLVVRNKVEGIPSDLALEAKKLIKPKPNRKFLLFWRFNAWIYLVTSKGKENRFKWSLKRSMGEEPALLDSATVKESAGVLNRFLSDHGYFRNKVRSEISIRNKRATITYFVSDSTRYKIRNITYPSGNGRIDTDIYLISPLSLLHKGDIYEYNKITAERTRIGNHLRDNGYFFFSRDFLFYELDTSVGGRQADLFLKLREPKFDYLYQTFTLDKIRINSNVDPSAKSPLPDSLNYERDNALDFAQIQDPSVKNEVIDRCIPFRPGDRFSDSKIRFSQARLSAIGIFNSINFRMNPIVTDTSRKLIVDLALTPAKKVETRLEGEGSTNSISLFGITGSYLVRDKNIFKGGELLEVKVNGGIESQQFNNPTLDGRNLPFNTVEYGVTASLQIPKFLWPLKKFNNSGYFAPKTRFSVSYFNQARYDYNRSILNFSLGYEWVNKANERWGVYPFELNLARTGNIDSVLQARLNAINDSFLKFSFTNHLTSSTRVTYTLNNLNHENPRKRTFSRISLESSGNIINFIQRLTDPNSSDYPRKILSLPYFQYIRFDLDFRKYWSITPQTYVAGRFFSGIGIPLENSSTLPLEKRYFVGGNNSLRAWLARQPGPGSFSGFGNNRVDQFGEMKLEMNAELRFPIFNILNGAVFVDAGNIWTLKDTVSSKSHLTNFAFDRFFNEFAINTGVGIRLNFTYFVIRFDVGMKLYDPAFQKGNRWVISHFGDSQWQNTGWWNQLNIPGTNLGQYGFFGYNLGIGVPF